MKLPTPGMIWPPYLPPALRDDMFRIIYKAALKEGAELEIIAEENNIYTLKITWPKPEHYAKPASYITLQPRDQRCTSK